MYRTGLALAVMLAVSALSLLAQAPPPAAGQQVHANLNQLMRGTLYPAANVVFSPQFENPGDVKQVPGKDPSMATDPLTSTLTSVSVPASPANRGARGGERFANTGGRIRMATIGIDWVNNYHGHADDLENNDENARGFYNTLDGGSPLRLG